MMRTTAAVTTRPNDPFDIRDVELDDLRSEEVLVRIMGVGICHTDLAMRSAGFYAPGVLGHEGAGIIEKVGNRVTELAPGDHVVLSYFACHHCQTCRSGKPAYCEHFSEANMSGRRVDGSSTVSLDGDAINGGFFYQSSFAGKAIAHQNNTVKVDSSLPIELLGPLGCGFQTGAGAVLNALNVKEGEGIAIFGAGAVGLAAVMAAKSVGANPIIVVDLVDGKLETARRLGATHVINGGETDPVEAIEEVSPGGVLYSLECVGLPKLLEQAVACLRTTGVCGLLGVSNPDAMASFNMGSLLNGRTIMGVIEGHSDPKEFIPRLVNLHRSGSFPFETLIKTYPLSEINVAIEDMKEGRVVKPVLLPA